MHPVICKIGQFYIYSYGLMLVAAFITATSLALMEAKRQRLDHEAIFNFLFTALVCGIIGSRIFYVLENLGYYAKNPLEIVMLQQGGLSWFGGLMLGSAAGIFYLKKRKLPIYRVLDLVAPYLALAQSIGRIGCLLNGCCFGRTPFLPTQIYASLALLAIYVTLRLMQNRPRPQGTIFYSYLLLYSIKRFTIEFWRLDNPVVFHGLTLFQLLSIGLFILAVAKLCLIKIKK